MAAGIWFWIIYVISLVFGVWSANDGQPLWWKRAGSVFVVFILLGLLGWTVFGPPMK